jgi:hypothetical protein
MMLYSSSMRARIIMDSPVQIPPDSILDDALIRQLLGIKADQLARARRAGELRFSRRGGRHFYIGKDVQQWIAGGADRDQPAVLDQGVGS